MIPSKYNQCNNVYGKCLNVKIINECTGSCNFCIERYGYKPNSISVEELIRISNELQAYQNVLILGGEPFLYKDLAQYLRGLHKREVYITTNGTAFDRQDLTELSRYLTAVNISIHSFDEEVNRDFLHTRADFQQIKDAIQIFQQKNVPVRINTILMKGGIDSSEKMLNMIDFVKDLGSSWIRFSELQMEKERFVHAEDIFDGIHMHPFYEGCNQELGEINGIKTTVRLSCGLASPCKEMPADVDIAKRCGADSKVLYADGTVSDGWFVPKGYRRNGWDACEKMIEIPY